MEFKSKKEFNYFINKLGSNIGMGSQGIVFYNPLDKKVYKVFHSYYDNNFDEEFYVKYDENEIIKFNNVNNNLYVWNEDVIKVEDEIIGSISKFVSAKNLYKINPLFVNLEAFIKEIIKAQKDIQTISNNGIKTFDVMYNILYGKDGFKIIDPDEYTYSSIDNDELYKINNDCFNYEILYFLVDCYFDKFVSDHKLLNEMYNAKDIDILEFITEFRNSLSEFCNHSIKHLAEARKCLGSSHKSNPRYIRTLM